MQPCFLLVGFTLLRACFCILAGTALSVYFTRKDKKGPRSFFCYRAVCGWFFLDLFFVHTFGWWFNFDYHLLYGDVLWALGWSMIVLAGLVLSSCLVDCGGRSCNGGTS